MPQPLIASETSVCCEEGVCDGCGTKDAPKDKQQHNDDCCPNGVCNPFQSCNCCFLHVVEKFQIVPKPILGSPTQKFSLYNESLTSTYTASFFHPPECFVV